MINITEKIKASIFLTSYFETLGFYNGTWEFNYNKTMPLNNRDVSIINMEILTHFFNLGGFTNIDITNWNSSDDTIMTIATVKACIKGGSEKDFINEYVNIIDILKEDKRISGITTLNSLDTIKRTRSINTLPYKQSMGGNGAAMRTGPIGLIYYKEEDLSKLIEKSIVASRVTHNYIIGFLGGFVSALFTSFAVRNIPVWEWSSKLIEIYESNIIDNYMKTTNIYEKYLKDKNIFFDLWYQYNEDRMNEFRNGSSQITNFTERTESLYKYQTNNNDYMTYYFGTSGLTSLIIAYDSMLSSFTATKFPIDFKNPNSATISLESVIFFSTLHSGDNDTTGAITGSWYGAMYGFNLFDKNKLKQLEFYKDINTCSEKIINLLLS